MAGLAGRLNDALVKMRLGKGRHEVQLWLRDGSYLHFRHDRHTRWVQAGGEEGLLAAVLAAGIGGFKLHGRRLSISFNDGSCLEIRQSYFGWLRRRLSKNRE